MMTDDVKKLATVVVELQTHYSHMAEDMKEVKEALKEHAKEAKTAHIDTQEQIQELKDLVNQGKGAYRLLIFLAGIMGGFVHAIANAFIGRG